MYPRCKCVTRFAFFSAHWQSHYSFSCEAIFMYRSIAKCLLAPAVFHYHQQHTNPQAHIDIHRSALTLKRKLIFFSLFVELYTPSRRQKATYMKSWSLLRAHVISSDIFRVLFCILRKLKKKKFLSFTFLLHRRWLILLGRQQVAMRQKMFLLTERQSGKEKIIVYQQRRKRNNHKKTSRYHQLRRRIYRAHRINITQRANLSLVPQIDNFIVSTHSSSLRLHRCCHCQKQLKRELAFGSGWEQEDQQFKISKIISQRNLTIFKYTICQLVVQHPCKVAQRGRWMCAIRIIYFSLYPHEAAVFQKVLQADANFIFNLLSLWFHEIDSPSASRRSPYNIINIVIIVSLLTLHHFIASTLPLSCSSKLNELFAQKNIQ